MDWLDWNEPRTERSQEIKKLCAAIAVRKRALIGAPLVALVAVGVCLMFAAPKYRAEAQVLIGRKSDASILASDTGPLIDVKNEAQLVASRDLARRAIKELGIDAKPEFDPMAAGLGPASRMLILLGLMRDPARMSLEERILKSYEERLSVSAPRRTGLVAIDFTSEDRNFAAEAANRIADLYLDMRAKAELGVHGDSDARIILRARAPRRLAYPDRALLFLSAASALVAALGAFVFDSFWCGPLPFRSSASANVKDEVEEPVQRPRALGQTAVFARLKNPDRRWLNVTADRAEVDNAQALADIVKHILSAKRGSRGSRIVVTGLSTARVAPDMMLALCRRLGREGGSIVVSLDKANRLNFGESSVAARNGEPVAPCNETGLGDLLSGRASFDEVIRRDPASRLHFVPLGAAGPIDLGELASVLEALTRTYDFIWLLTPPLDQDNMARLLAAEADSVVLAAPPSPHEGLLCEAQAELVECGAREVLVIGEPARFHPRFGQDAA
jgi:capsular polysaccharide biosynthesis protein